MENKEASAADLSKKKFKYNEKDFDPEYLQEIGPLMAVTVGLAIRRVGDK